VLPLAGSTVESQLNAITRLIIIIFLVVLIFNWKQGLVFLVSGILIVIIIYFLERKMVKENYQFGNTDYQNIPESRIPRILDSFGMNHNRFCNDGVDEKTLYETESINQQLQTRGVSKLNERTKIPPVIVPPPTDQEWAVNNLYVRSNINTESPMDYELSGYESNCNSNCSGGLGGYTKPCPSPRVSRGCGYDRDNDDYNRNMATQMLQPGVYSQNDVIEPISWNIGISETPQHQPRSFDGSTFRRGGIAFPSYVSSQTVLGPNDIYDPRQSGYGSSNRSYNDPRSGTPKFYYDDVDDVRRPKFIQRSNIDVLGPDQVQSFSQVDDAYRDMSMYHRMDLSERAMEKINSINYVRRLAPTRRDCSYNFKN
jgi:hypothetical protein